MARVLFQAATKRFGDVTALRDFSLEVGDGEFVVLVGPSGSGKTTALRLVAGLEALTSGDIRGRAEYVEMLGRETLIGVATGGDLRFAVLADPDVTVKPGTAVRFGLEPGRLHLFDASTSQALGIV
jgi:ABC-type sugar transport system ATPase subunit